MKKEARGQKPETGRRMRRLPALVESAFRRILILTSAFWLLACFPLRSEIIDKIVAMVDTHIITLSDLRQERSIRTILGEKAIDDDDALIRQLVENYLIESQIADFPGTEPSDEEIDAELMKFQVRDGLSPEVLRDVVRKRIRMAKYFEARFRQFIRPSDDDVRKYYDTVFVPEAKSRNLDPIPPFEQVAEAIRKNVIEEQLGHDVDNWLEAIRRRSDIEILK
jgi:hypothetical protein